MAVSHFERGLALCRAEFQIEEVLARKRPIADAAASLPREQAKVPSFQVQRSRKQPRKSVAEKRLEKTPKAVKLNAKSETCHPQSSNIKVPTAKFEGRDTLLNDAFSPPAKDRCANRSHDERSSCVPWMRMQDKKSAFQLEATRLQAQTQDVFDEDQDFSTACLTPPQNRTSKSQETPRRCSPPANMKRRRATKNDSAALTKSTSKILAFLKIPGPKDVQRRCKDTLKSRVAKSAKETKIRVQRSKERQHEIGLKATKRDEKCRRGKQVLQVGATPQALKMKSATLRKAIRLQAQTRRALDSIATANHSASGDQQGLLADVSRGVAQYAKRKRSQLDIAGKVCGAKGRRACPLVEGSTVCAQLGNEALPIKWDERDKRYMFTFKVTDQRYRSGCRMVKFQTTVKAANGSKEHAERICRMCYARFKGGASKSNVIQYRNAMYHQLCENSVSDNARAPNHGKSLVRSELQQPQEAAQRGDVCSRRNKESCDDRNVINDKVVLILSRAVEEALSQSQRTRLQAMGASFLDVEDDEHATHLVIMPARLPRTLRVMCAVSRGHYVVRHAWLCASLRAGNWVSEAGYEPTSGYRARRPELKVALDRARSSPLLAGRVVWISPSIPERSSLEFLVRAAGGQVLREQPVAPDKTEAARLLLIGSCKDRAVMEHLPLHNPELLFEGAMCQQLKEFDSTYLV